MVKIYCKQVFHNAKQAQVSYSVIQDLGYKCYAYIEENQFAVKAFHTSGNQRINLQYF